MSNRSRSFTAADLYGTTGQPQLPDIQQDEQNDCYLLAPMGALAAQQPERIRDMISYGPSRNNPAENVFAVTLFRPDGAPERIEVTSADVEYNIQRQGGSRADNTSGAPIWPAVIESAFAKLHDPDPQNNSLVDAYRYIGKADGGGSLNDGMYALTGESSRRLRIPGGAASASSGSTTRSSGDDTPTFRAPTIRREDMTEQQVYTEVRNALNIYPRRPVTMSTRTTEINDGLLEGHAYTVTGIEQRNDGRTWVTLRNPYANNNDPNGRESGNTSDPSISVRLDRIVSSGALGEFAIGPPPRVQTQQQGAPNQIAPNQPSPSAPGTNSTSQTQAADPRDPNHPDHRLYLNVRAGVERAETGMGRTWDDNSDRLTASLTLLAKQKGYGPDDRFEVGFSTRTPTSVPQPGELVFLNRVGSVSPDPAANRAEMQTTQALAQPADATFRNLDAYNQAQRETQARTVEQQPTQTPAGPTTGGPDDPQPPVLKR